jgi:hypothetical protein
MAVHADDIAFDGIVADRVRWLLGEIERFSPDVELRDTSAELNADDPKGFFQWLSGQIGGFELVSATRDSENEATVRVSCPNGRSWVLQVRLEAGGARRIDWVGLDRALLDGMEVRVATEADAAGIREVCCNAPIVLRDETVAIDPGPNYFDAIRLMEFGGTVLVATHHDRVVAVHCGTFYPIRYGGERQWMSQILHSRVLGDYAGLGLWSVMNRRLVNNANAKRREAADSGDPVFQNGCAYFAVENDATRRLNGAQDTWSFQPFRAVLPCEALAERAGAFTARPATPDDAARIVELVNAAHGGEELFVPYTEESLRSRLERAADVYSWPSLFLSERAVVGVWMAGRTHTRRAKSGPDGEAEVSVRALVLDYGFEPGAEEELGGLLRAVAAEAHRAGMTDLSIFTSDGSRGSGTLRALAARLEHYELATPYTPEPEGAASRGLYVDQVYF